jgi:hypothetical protein
VKAPIFGGAGIGMETVKDERPPASDINPLAEAVASAVGLENLTHFGRPKSVKFFVWYNYGASLELTNILSGEIKGRLRIKFAFFSRTWRKRIVKFNGFSRTFQLISGKVGLDPAIDAKPKAIDYKDKNGQTAGASTLVVEGTNDVGVSEAQVPLLVLQPLDVPETPEPSPDDVPFNKNEVQDLFYDNLCCAKPGDPVISGEDQCVGPGGIPTRGGAVPCCPGYRCNNDPDQTRCVFDCKTTGQECADTSQCCTIAQHEVSCGSGVCERCAIPSEDTSGGGPCNVDSDCCGWDAPNSHVVCGENHECIHECRAEGDPCLGPEDCCLPENSQRSCVNNACEVCGIASVTVGNGGACDTREDCCNFAQNNAIQCNDGECVQVVQSP